MTRHDDTAMGGKSEKFPRTHLSAIHALRSGEENVRERAFSVLAAAYWKPVYKHIRIKWGKSNEDAKDLTQAFFARVLEKEFFSSYDPAKARFRTFLRVCLDRFIANEEAHAGREKRGGNALVLSIDYESADAELTNSGTLHQPASPGTVEQAFEQEWVRSLFALAIASLQEECAAKGKTVHYKLFEAYDLVTDDQRAQLSYGELAREFGIRPTDVTNYLAYARREFRACVLATLRELTATDEEYRSEALSLLGVEPE